MYYSFAINIEVGTLYIKVIEIIDHIFKINHESLGGISDLIFVMKLEYYLESILGKT